MTIVSFHLGPVPNSEPCASVGSPDYGVRSLLECKVFRRMLERQRPVPENVSARYVVRSLPHDFGEYREVCIDFDAEEPEALAFASEVESNTPENWDTQAVFELIWFARRDDYHAALARGEIKAQEIPALYRRIAAPVVPDGMRLTDMLKA
jgi:hypothetical protein